jgi:hypothetical protein
MRWRWFGRRYLDLLFVILSWNVFMVVWYRVVVARGQWSLEAFVALCGAVNAGLLYGLAAGLVNSTSIRAWRGRLEVRHGPLPWPGNRVLPPQQIGGLYTRERVARSKFGTRITYEVRAELREGKDVRLVGGMPREEQARFVQQQIEAACNLAE